MKRLEIQVEEFNSGELRPSSSVMKLDRLGALFPNRLSFSHILLRRMAKESWAFTKEYFSLNSSGVGTAIYRVETKTFPLWFVVFADHLAPKDRNDRVIAEKWDVTFTLTAEKPDRDKLQGLKQNVPLQEGGRFSNKEIILSRANKSIRLFNHVVKKLAAGVQPKMSRLIEVGYLIRTTAVYGNGKFGLADFGYVKNQGWFSLPFEAEMLCVYLARHFSFDWVEHIAYCKNASSFQPLDATLKKAMGIGNSTGLGMAPFLVNHPKLLSKWVLARENALRDVVDIKFARAKDKKTLLRLIDHASLHINEWSTSDPIQHARIDRLKSDIPVLQKTITATTSEDFWKNLLSWSTRSLSLETQELLNSLILETKPHIADRYEYTTTADEEMEIDCKMLMSKVLSLIEKHYSWVLKLELESKDANARFWYRSEEKEEPRFGWRDKDPEVHKEMRIGIAQTVNRLYKLLASGETPVNSATVAEFLLHHDSFREIILRIQNLYPHEYSEIEDNLLDKSCRPIDLLRCKLAMFGATKFDPKSDLWIRITLFQGAPLTNEMQSNDTGLFSFFYSSQG